MPVQQGLQAGEQAGVVKVRWEVEECELVEAVHRAGEAAEWGGVVMVSARVGVVGVRCEASQGGLVDGVQGVGKAAGRGGISGEQVGVVTVGLG